VAAPEVRSAPRRKVIEHPGRFAIVAGGLTVVALLFAGAIKSADTKDRRTALPSQVQSVSPKSGAIVPPQEQISVDLRDDLTADLSLCAPSQAEGACTALPADQVDFIPALGQLTFRPGEGKAVEAYDPGQNRVIVAYRSQRDPARDNGVYSWSFVSKS
jgi:ABC-type phosphate/phosphonate transport system substrate-binding protein